MHYVARKRRQLIVKEGFMRTALIIGASRGIGHELMRAGAAMPNNQLGAIWC
jgi:hypothetical protein